MRISTNSKILYSRMSEIEAVKYFEKCGFTALDLGMLDMWEADCPKNQSNYVEYAKELKKVADGCGIIFNQAHAPMHSSYIDEAKTAKAYDLIKRSIEIAAIAGVKNIIVHPKQHLEYPENAEILKQQNIEFFDSLLKFSEGIDINILTENMWRTKGSNKIFDSVCAPADEFRDYVDMMQSDRFGACLDIGHTYLVHRDIPDMIRTLDHRIWGLHIHDVAWDNDLHTMPFFGSIKNWEEIMKTLAEVGYKGDITFEMKALDNIPDILLEDTLKMLHRVGETLAEMVESNRWFMVLFLRGIYNFFKSNIVMTVALLAAVITSVIIPPDSAYIGYFDFKTLTCLFCVLAVVCALKNIRFFYILARKIVEICGNIRTCVLMLVYITFIGSMLIANDMALLTFLPLGYYVLTATKQEKHMEVTFILQNIAANLGGMLTPFGNPQNLYLYSYFEIDNLEFMGIMAPCFVVAIILITVCCLIFIKPEKATLQKQKINLPPVRTIIYLLLFVYSILIVFRGISYWTGLIIIPLFLIFMDRDALKAVDYPLLLTFVFFFIFAGNMARIDAVREFFSFLLSKNTLIVSVLSCQVISNVPSAVLLSQFTNNYADLLVGVNIGGAGTLIASLASLITFREYAKHNPTKFKHYIVTFSLFNFGFLAVLTIFSLVWNAVF